MIHASTQERRFHQSLQNSGGTDGVHLSLCVWVWGEGNGSSKGKGKNENI